jgi:hypothetical protein
MSVKSLRNTIFTAVAQCVTNKDVTDKLSEFSKAFAEHTLEKEDNLGLSIIVNTFDSISSTLNEHPSLSLAMTAARGLCQAIAPELMGSMIEDFEYAKLQAFLKTPDPNQLNHDLNRLIKKSAIRAIGFIERLYLDKLKKEQDQTSVKGFFIKPEYRLAFESLCKNLKNELEKWLESNVIEDSVLEDASDCLQTLTDAIFETSEIDKNSEFATFFKQNLPFCFDLAVKEALKDKQSDKEFKAFQIWILENINEKITSGNNKILAEIHELKNQKDTFSSTKFKTYLDDECEGLHLRFNEIFVVLVEIKEKVTEIHNPQPTLTYDFSHQVQSENKAIFRRRYVPFVGREAEMENLFAFFHSPNLLEWQLITSAGGSGKSRLAMEFCYALAAQNKDYELGFYSVNGKDKIDWQKWQPLNKTLIVIDYVATDYKTILEILAALYLRVNTLQYPVRFLLLEREKNGEWWKKFEEYYKVENYIPNPFGEAIDLPPLYNYLKPIIVFCLQKANKPSPNTEKEWYEIIENLLTIDPLGRPLFAFYVGLALANGETIRNWKVEDLLENHLKREETHFWKNENTNHDLLEKHKNLLALATMMGGMSFDVLDNLLEKKYLHLPSIDEFDTTIYENLSDIREETLRPLEPDILGEYLVHKQLQKDPKNPLKNRNKATELVGEAWHKAPIAMDFFVLRFCQDFLEYDTRINLLTLPTDANEETNYWYCSMFLDLSGVLMNKGLVSETEDFWKKIQTICLEKPSDRLLIQKVSVAYNLALHFGKNNLLEKAEGLYGQICGMESQDLPSEVLQEVLIKKVKAAYNLALHFGKNNLLEKAEGLYGQICGMESQDLPSEVLQEVLIQKVKAANNLVAHLGNNNLLEKAEGLYGQICGMESQDLPSEVVQEVLIEKVKAAYNLALDFGNNNLLEKAEGLYGQICGMESQDLPSEVLQEVLIKKVKAAYNLALHFGNNNLLEKAEGLYGQICAMESQDLPSEVLQEVLIKKVQAAYNLALDFGKNNLLEKAEGLYGQICAMESQDLPSEVLQEVLIKKVKAASNLALDFGKNNLLEKAEGMYGQICDMESQDLPSEVLQEVLIQKVKAAGFLYTIKEFESWHLALQWIAEELLQTYDKHPIAESAIRIEFSLIDFYRKYQTELPAETSEQIKQVLIKFATQYHEDDAWQPYLSFVIEAFKEFGLLPNGEEDS